MYLIQGMIIFVIVIFKLIMFKFKRDQEIEEAEYNRPIPM
jgi:hypothetical protein